MASGLSATRNPSWLTPNAHFSITPLTFPTTRPLASPQNLLSARFLTSSWPAPHLSASLPPFQGSIEGRWLLSPCLGLNKITWECGDRTRVRVLTLLLPVRRHGCLPQVNQGGLETETPPTRRVLLVSQGPGPKVCDSGSLMQMEQQLGIQQAKETLTRGGHGGTGGRQSAPRPFPIGAQGTLEGSGDTQWEQGLRSGELRSTPRHMNWAGPVFVEKGWMHTQMTEGPPPPESPWGQSVSPLPTETIDDTGIH